MKDFDVYAYGVIAASELHLLSMPFPPLEVIDSAGAGDSFRAGVIYELLQQWGDEQTIQCAAAVAGLVCASFPGVLNSPTHAEVMQFIQSHTL